MHDSRAIEDKRTASDGQRGADKSGIVWDSSIREKNFGNTKVLKGVQQGF